jgi:hypothetical protein
LFILQNLGFIYQYSAGMVTVFGMGDFFDTSIRKQVKHLGSLHQMSIFRKLVHHSLLDGTWNRAQVLATYLYYNIIGLRKAIFTGLSIWF